MDVAVDEKCWIDKLPNEIVKQIMELLVTFEREYRPELSEYNPIDSRDLRALTSAWPSCRPLAQQLYYAKLHIRNFRNNGEELALGSRNLYGPGGRPNHHIEGTKSLCSALETKQNPGSLCQQVRISLTNMYPKGYEPSSDTELLAKMLDMLSNAEKLCIDKQHQSAWQKPERMWDGLLRRAGSMENLKQASLSFIHSEIELEEVLDLQWGPNMKKLQLRGHIGVANKKRFQKFRGQNISSLSLDISTTNPTKSEIFKHWATALEEVSFYRQDDYFGGSPPDLDRHIPTLRVFELKCFQWPDIEIYRAGMYDFSMFTALEDLKVHGEILRGGRDDRGPFTEHEARCVLGAPKLRKFTWCLPLSWWKDSWGAEVRWLRGLAQAAAEGNTLLREMRVELDVKSWDPRSQKKGWRPLLNLRDELEILNRECGGRIVVSHNLGGIKA